ncbi:hypothetical protein J437_LFUL012240 [Ladona fulva]|uniref:Uncharacterized protein n=1 Tax=Ladona fulva TaxID=123851 RepID=A0A8K0KH17_LADFU|nr:hypothetical protein J437_LFUL012240 [Ladona fulva]
MPTPDVVKRYSIPDQARIESRTSDGTVRGSYSYLDPIGRTITVQYIADDSGYHAATNEATPGSTVAITRDQGYNLQYYAASAPNLVPASVVGSIPRPIEDTPEVAAAREAHLRLHQAALEAHAAAIAAVTGKESGEQPPMKVDFEEDVGEEIEEEDNTSEVNTGAASDESDEGVVIESDALSDNAAGAGISGYDDDDHELTYEKDRYPKLQYTSLPETFDPAKVHDEESNSVIVTNPEFADEPVSTRIGGQQGDQKENVEGHKEISQITATIPGKGAFFYSFRHAVPVYVSVPQEQQHQYQQVPPGRFYGVYTRPAQQPPQQHHQQRLSVSERASLLGAVPVAAVHDSQVSPAQRDSLKDHQTLPLYITPIEIEEN